MYVYAAQPTHEAPSLLSRWAKRQNACSESCFTPPIRVGSGSLQLPWQWTLTEGPLYIFINAGFVSRERNVCQDNRGYCNQSLCQRLSFWRTVGLPLHFILVPWYLKGTLPSAKPKAGEDVEALCPIPGVLPSTATGTYINQILHWVHSYGIP